MYVTLKSHLATLQDLERAKPEGLRREVPSMAELARIADVHPMTISRWVNGDINATNHTTVAAIITELRRRGFDTEVSDLLAYDPPGEVPTTV